MDVVCRIFGENHLPSPTLLPVVDVILRKFLGAPAWLAHRENTAAFKPQLVPLIKAQGNQKPAGITMFNQGSDRHKALSPVHENS